MFRCSVFWGSGVPCSGVPVFLVLLIAKTVHEKVLEPVKRPIRNLLKDGLAIIQSYSLCRRGRGLSKFSGLSKSMRSRRNTLSAVEGMQSTNCTKSLHHIRLISCLGRRLAWIFKSRSRLWILVSYYLFVHILNI